MHKKYLSPQEFEDEYGIWKAQTIYNRTSQKLRNFPIPHIKTDKGIFFKRTEIEKYLERQTINQL